MPAALRRAARRYQRADERADWRDLEADTCCEEMQEQCAANAEAAWNAVEAARKALGTACAAVLAAAGPEVIAAANDYFLDRGLGSVEDWRPRPVTPRRRPLPLPRPSAPKP